MRGSPEWQRVTELADPRSFTDAEREAITLAAERRGLVVAFDGADLAWVTESTSAPMGFFRKRSQTARVAGVVEQGWLVWSTTQNGDGPHALAVPLASAEVTEHEVFVASLPEALRAGADDEGVHLRGDLGGPERASVFLGLGTGPAADAVSARLRAAAGGGGVSRG